VEVVLEGPEGDVRQVLGALDGRDAPGRVTGVASRRESAQGAAGFTTA
jgi:acylphosphatase